MIVTKARNDLKALFPPSTFPLWQYLHSSSTNRPSLSSHFVRNPSHLNGINKVRGPVLYVGRLGYCSSLAFAFNNHSFRMWKWSSKIDSDHLASNIQTSTLPSSCQTPTELNLVPIDFNLIFFFLWSDERVLSVAWTCLNPPDGWWMISQPHGEAMSRSVLKPCLFFFFIHRPCNENPGSSLHYSWSCHSQYTFWII